MLDQGLVRFSSGEVTFTSDYPNLGLCQYLGQKGLLRLHTLGEILSGEDAWAHSTSRPAACGFRLGRVPGTREHVVHPNYIVVYQVGDDVIDILRILHSRQQYP